MTSKTNVIAAIFSIMNKVENNLQKLMEEYVNLYKGVDIPGFDPYIGFHSSLDYGNLSEEDPLGNYQWLLKEGLLGAIAQINGQETFRLYKMGDYLLGVLNSLYKADENWADDPDYKILSDYRNSH